VPADPKKKKTFPMRLVLGTTVGINVTELVVTNAREGRHTTRRL
jgi:hypothetical protein